MQFLCYVLQLHIQSRRYATLLAFTLTFGPYVVQKLSTHQVKVNCMLSLPFKQRTDTVQLISEYIRRCFLDAYPQADIQHIKQRLLELSKDGNRYVEKFNAQIDKLTKSVHNKPLLRNTFSLYDQLPH